MKVLECNPLINKTFPFVISITDNLYYMYYVAGVEWIHKDLPKYNIQLAISNNGLDWKRDGHVCIDFKNKEDCISWSFTESKIRIF